MRAKSKPSLSSQFELLLSIVSIGFVIALSVGVDWRRITLEFNYFYIFLSLVLCFLGFLFQGLSWQHVLSAFGIDVSKKLATCSIAKTIFSKYIPGKIWMLLGRASYISNRLELSLKSVAKASIFCQVLSLVFAFFLLAILSFNLNLIQLNFPLLKLGFLLFMVIILVLLFMYFPRQKSKFTVNLKMVACFVGMWLSWGFGFSVLCLGTPIVLPAQFDALAFVFISASVAGIVAFIFPGGLGVREGGIIGLLTLWNVSLQDSITIAILARVWFLLAETIFFIFFSIRKP